MCIRYIYDWSEGEFLSEVNEKEEEYDFLDEARDMDEYYERKGK